MKSPLWSARPLLCASGDMSLCQSEPVRLHSPPLDITCQLRGISTIPVKRGGFSDIYDGVWISGDTRLKVALKVVHVTSRDARTRRVSENPTSVEV
ncbi:hypothetical protein EXIGLDRAFT_198654 [Exidia glandulosa HHB12029]|uniref:Protein kinase domain-containing protein n=1 Tax=Exidia glandulosa HHB12029 TaxID=1314781 RepID=A0A165MXL5_EXIGL|nr:hypothetical protein EXIGLDRAFT_198654 [Exidia glandulosa HHB12029]